MPKREDVLRTVQNLRLIDDNFFNVCFHENIECTELLLHIILGRSDLKVIRVSTQEDLPNLRGRSVRLDAYAEDSQGRKYNIEVQRKDRGANARRARYNSSLIDAHLLEHGEECQNLPDTYVIFITEKDFFRRGLPIYSFHRTCEETDIHLEDGSHIIYVNGAYQGESPIGMLMSDFRAREPEKIHYSALQKQVYYFKKTSEGVERMCAEVERLNDIAREEGRNQGRNEGARETAKNMLSKGFTVEIAAECTGLPIAEIKAIAESMKH